MYVRRWMKELMKENKIYKYKTRDMVNVNLYAFSLHAMLRLILLCWFWFLVREFLQNICYLHHQVLNVDVLTLVKSQTVSVVEDLFLEKSVSRQ